MNKNLYKQYDSRWGSKPYPTKKSSFSGNGCGCVACTHLIIEQEQYKDLTPEPVRQWMVKQGFAVANQGTTWNGIPRTLEHYGYKVTHVGISDPMTKAWNELNKGNRIGIILFLGGKAPNGMVWTSGGHYVAFTDYYVKDGKHWFYTKDSGGRDNDSATHGYYSYENSMRGLVYQMWIVEKINVVKDSTPAPAQQSTPAITPSSSASISKLDVDGIFGPKSIKRMQQQFGTPADGLITGQLAKLKKYHRGFGSGSIKYGVNGSYLVKALQQYLNLSGPDGQLGPNTITALQEFLQLSGPDGIWGPNTSRAMQKWLNANPTLPKNTSTSGHITQASSSRIKGMDISAWQDNCSVADFQKAKASGINFVILRVGFTGTESRKPTLDKCFENNYANAKAAGLKIGYYFYSTATSEAMAQKEAEFTLAHIKGKQCDMPVYLDVEDPQYQSKLSKTALANICNKFCNLVNAAGYKAGVYASLNWFNNKIGNISAPHSKWVAQYYDKCEYKGAYDMWQYTSEGSVPGIGNRIDLDYWYSR